MLDMDLDPKQMSCQKTSYVFGSFFPQIHCSERIVDLTCHEQSPIVSKIACIHLTETGTHCH